MDKPIAQYCWIDMETTGLNAQEDVPLEVALILTDEWGNPIAECSYLIHDETSQFRDMILFAKQHEIVGPMHDASGLWHDLAQREMVSNCYSIYETDFQLVKFLRNNDVEKGTIPLAGNSIGSLDRPFVLNWFPKFNDYLHYRNVDMSSFKEVCRKVNPSLFERLEPIIGTKANATHRALDDVRASIREYCAYLDNFLFTE